ncbi:double-stranded RNA-binding protein Staufen homolog 2 isoform X3 [Photinus pyralis]|nr:double-stranded RNA-binding protein Staufen homolog 2 isoform X3 [Photinus pyralis]
MGPPPNARTQPMLMSLPPTVPVPHSDMKTFFLLMLCLSLSSNVTALSITELKTIMGNQACIEGVLVTMPQGTTLITSTAIPHQPQPKSNMAQLVHYDTEITENSPDQITTTGNTNTSSTMPTNNLANNKEKTPMCLINELARYNKIQHQYRLTSEQGPAHKKLFTVTLKLGNEEYEAEGASIKKAQHSAAAMALQQTEFKHPPPKTNRNSRGSLRNGSGMVTPTVELNALAMKRGERTVYVLENGAPAPAQGYIPQASYYPRHVYNPGQPRYAYDPRRNASARNYHTHYENRYYSQYRYQHPPGEPFSIRLRVGEREYPGMGYTVQAARHDAAAKAIEDIKQKEVDDSQQCPANNGNTYIYMPHSFMNPMLLVLSQNDVCNELNSELKSPISLVHEIALKRSLNVIFEVLSEKGPPHMKVFVTQCRVGDFMTEGEGNGKKISKKKAAEKMLEELSKLGPLPNTNSQIALKRKRVVNKKKQRNLIKVNTDRATDYTEEINPISRLIQIQQANKEKEPVYNVIDERGAPRRREFVIEASVNGHVSTGIGPNKKVAKRNAAEALLQLLGYTNTSPAQSVPKPALKVEKEVETIEKTRKVTFMEEKQENHIGGSGGRQLVPGLLLVNDHTVAFQQSKTKTSEATTSGTNSGDAGKGGGSGQTPKKSPTVTQSVRAKDQLIYLAQLLGVQVQFSDFPKANHEMYLTLVSLSTNPPQVCHGEGPSTDLSHEKAALEALSVLSELGLDNVTPTKDASAENVHGNKPQVQIPKGGINQNGIKKQS